MKKFASILAVTLLLVGCIKETNQEKSDTTSVDLKVAVSANDLITRAGNSEGFSSALGAIQNFGDEDWAKYDLRYTFEIYPANDDGTSAPLKERQVQVVERYDSENYVYFYINIEPSRSYRFVIFADIVKQDERGDLYYDTTDLRNITMKEGTINPLDEARDAYFATKKVTITGQSIEPIMLKRPFGKLRIVTTDYDFIENYAAPAKAELTYYNCELFKSFNAVDGTISTTLSEAELTHEFNISKGNPYSAGVDEKPANMTLFTDYLLVAPEGQRELHFTLTIWDKDDRLINGIDCMVPVWVERNNLTTVSGNILTQSANINIDINHELKEGDTLNPDLE